VISKKRGSAFLALFTTMLLVLSACGSGSGSDGDGESDPSVENTSQDADAPVENTSQDADATDEDSSTGGSLVVAIPGDIDNFDPATNQTITAVYAIGNTVFNSLVGLDADLTIVPELAEEFESNDDASVFTFTLVEGATFHDGSPVTSEAVVESLQRSAEIGGVFGGPLQRVTSFETPDERTLVLTLDGPFAPFLSTLAPVAILAPASFETATTDPIGSGPFKFESWTPNDKIVLERNDDYWGDQPAFDTLELRPITDSQVALANLLAGDVDIISEPSIAVVDQFGESDGAIVRPSSSNSIGYIEMMGTTDVLADVLLRRAIAHAFDRETIREIAFGGEGESVWSPLPTGSFAYEEQEGYPFDLDRAAELVAEAGAEGTTIGLEILAGFPEAEQMARVWQADLEKIGIALDIRVSEVSVWLDRYVPRDYDMTWNFFGVSPDPDSFFEVLMAPHLGDRYPNAEMEALIAEASSISDPEARAEIYAELQAIMVEDLPIMTLQSRPIAGLTRTGVVGYAMNPMGWGLFEGVSLNE